MTAAIATTKTCRACGQAKALDAFYRDRSARDGVGSKCRDCWRTKAAPAPRPSAPRPARDEPPAEFEAGQTCINCGRSPAQFPPEERQLPRTSARFPLCSDCLRWARRIEGPRFGIMEA